MYCVYVTIYTGDLLSAKKYVGSTSVSSIESGYRGSVASKEYSSLWESEIRNNHHLFEIKIISKHKSRKAALRAELIFQQENDVVKSPDWLNKSEARVNGFFGMDVSGTKNPMFGKSRKGETHKGGENISAGLKNHYKTERGAVHKKQTQERISKNNPIKQPEIVEKLKVIWKESERNLGSKNGMYGKIGKLRGKKLYNNGIETRAFLVGQQPEGWSIGRH
jgi:hypothetical protein